MWLHSLIEKIHAVKALPVERRALLVLCANELAAVCDQLSRSAPCPEVMATDSSGAAMLAWSEPRRLLLFGVTSWGLPVLLMQDGAAQHRIENPPHDELRRSVLAFLEAGHV